MKRKVSLIICIVFAMTASVIMTSCGKSSERALDPYKILKAASDKWKNIKDIDMDMSLNMTDNSKRTNAKIDANINFFYKLSAFFVAKFCLHRIGDFVAFCLQLLNGRYECRAFVDDRSESVV